MLHFTVLNEFLKPFIRTDISNISRKILQKHKVNEFTYLLKPYTKLSNYVMWTDCWIFNEFHILVLFKAKWLIFHIFQKNQRSKPSKLFGHLGLKRCQNIHLSMVSIFCVSFFQFCKFSRRKLTSKFLLLQCYQVNWFLFWEAVYTADSGKNASFFVIFGHIRWRRLIFAVFSILWRNGPKLWKNILNPQSFYL